MKINHQNRLWLDMIILAELALTNMSEEEIQENFGSDYYQELKAFLRKVSFRD